MVQFPVLLRHMAYRHDDVPKSDAGPGDEQQPPERPRNILSIFASVLTVAVVTVLMISGYTEATKKTAMVATKEQGSQLFEVWQSYWFVPLGAALMIAVAVYQILIMITGARSGLAEAPEAAFIND